VEAPTVKRVRTCIALGLAMLSFPGPAWSQTVTCIISSKYGCEADGCNQVQAAVRNVLDLSRQTYTRCDTGGCDNYEARISRSGAFIVIDLPGRGMTAKIAADLSAFVEVATIGTTVLVSFGSCR
jgi:hypothetical protein